MLVPAKSADAITKSGKPLTKAPGVKFLRMGARDALRQTFGAVRSNRASYQMEQALQTQVKKVAQQHPNTVYGARADIQVETIGKSLKMFPPEMRQQEQRNGKSRTKG